MDFLSRMMLKVVFLVAMASIGVEGSSARGEETLESVLTPLIQAHKGKVAVVVKNLDTGESFAYHADEPMVTASLIKFPIMVEAYRQAAEKKVDLDKPITLKQSDKVPGSGILTTHISEGAALPLKDYIHLMIVYLRQHGDEPGPGTDRNRLDRRDDGADGLPEHQGAFQGLQARDVSLSRAEQAIRHR